MSANEIDDGVAWAFERHRVTLSNEILAELIRRTDKRRADSRNPLGVHEAKRFVLPVLMKEHPDDEPFRDVYSSAAGHIYAMRRKEKRARLEAKNRPAPMKEHDFFDGIEIPSRK